MKIKILSPQHGDQVLELAPREATELIFEEQRNGRAGFVKFSDGEVFNLMKRTGILQQLQKRELKKTLEEKEESGAEATIVPLIAGG